MYYAENSDYWYSWHGKIKNESLGKWKIVEILKFV